MKLIIKYTDGSSPFRLSAPIDTLLFHIRLQVEACPRAIKSIRIVHDDRKGGLS